MKRFRAGVHQDTGASAVEYGLIVFAVAALIALAVFSFGGAVRGLFQNSCDTIKQASETSATSTCGP
jgi:pilus assembly protein Flp/PilA